jgi:ABC-type multidrug transport system fused ATPase/permease subunit
METDSTNAVNKPNITYNGPLLEFRSVSMKYPGSRENVIQDISFQIYSRQKVGIIGR